MCSSRIWCGHKGDSYISLFVVHMSEFSRWWNPSGPVVTFLGTIVYFINVRNEHKCHPDSLTQTLRADKLVILWNNCFCVPESSVVSLTFLFRVWNQESSLPRRVLLLSRLHLQFLHWKIKSVSRFSWMLQHSPSDFLLCLMLLVDV